MRGGWQCGRGDGQGQKWCNTDLMDHVLLIDVSCVWQQRRRGSGQGSRLLCSSGTAPVEVCWDDSVLPHHQQHHRDDNSKHKLLVEAQGMGGGVTRIHVCVCVCVCRGAAAATSAMALLVAKCM